MAVKQRIHHTTTRIGYKSSNKYKSSTIWNVVVYLKTINKARMIFNTEFSTQNERQANVSSSLYVCCFCFVFVLLLFLFRSFFHIYFACSAFCPLVSAPATAIRFRLCTVYSLFCVDYYRMKTIRTNLLIFLYKHFLRKIHFFFISNITKFILFLKKVNNWI